MDAERMSITSMIPRHGAELVRVTVVPALSGAERLAWIAAHEWPLLGALGALGVLVALGGRVTPGELDPILVGGYVVGFIVTRLAAREVARCLVRLEVVAVRR